MIEFPGPGPLVTACAACGKIRGADGEWRGTEPCAPRPLAGGLTHGVCPECRARLYPELDVVPPAGVGADRSPAVSS